MICKWCGAEIDYIEGDWTETSEFAVIPVVCIASEHAYHTPDLTQLAI